MTPAPSVAPRPASLLAASLLAVLMTLGGCEKAPDAAPAASAAPQGLTDAMCGACGMVVAEQPSPRGQLVYRDGHHVHACSLGDLALLVASPSPHGKPVAVFVEPQDALPDPMAVDRAAQPQLAAASLHYVTGVQRRGIMGTPLLAFRDRARAEAAARAHGGSVVDWARASAPR
ncbi:MAG: nitrous oxide reductase accessory protein NosL [Deltaproteobacteria bacterium]|nr:nitrous oxide reductase accessory protein NosL [Deltaproteobacteria bacterium]